MSGRFSISYRCQSLSAFPPQLWANMGSNPTYFDYRPTWAPMPRILIMGQHGLRPDVFWDLELKFHFEIENFIQTSNLSPHPWFSGFSHVSHPSIFMFLKNHKCLQCSGRCYIVMHRAVQCKNMSMFLFFVGCSVRDQNFLIRSESRSFRLLLENFPTKLRLILVELDSRVRLWTLSWSIIWKSEFFD